EAARQEDGAPGAAVSEAQRFFQQGERLRQEGKDAEARRGWKGVAAGVAGGGAGEEGGSRAREGPAELGNPEAARGRGAPVGAALKRAAALRDEGKLAEAERIWDGIEALYGPEGASAREILREVREARQKKPAGK